MPSLPRLLALAASLAVAAPALAQTYPSKPVKIMVPFAAGGIADITTRFVADRLSTKLGQQFVVENKAGPGGIDAARAIACGADAAFAGKSFLWSLGALGPKGPAHLLRIYTDELRATLGQLGCRNVEELRSVKTRHPTAWKPEDFA